MKNLTTLWIVGLLLLTLVLGCEKSEKSTNSTQQATPDINAVTPKTVSVIDQLLTVPKEFKPTYKILKVRDVSTESASRFAVDVSLPKNTGREEIENNLKIAAKEQYEKSKADALQIFCYVEGRSVDSSNMLGSLTFAPYGDWGRANEKITLDKYKLVFASKTLIDSSAETSDLEKKALAGDYQAQRNLAFYLSTGADGYQMNPVKGCAWRLVILKSGSSKIDESDRFNKTSDCDQKLNSQQLKQAEIEGSAILKKINGV